MWTRLRMWSEKKGKILCEFGVCLPCYTWDFFIGQGLFWNSTPCSIVQNFCSILKIITGCVEWASRHPPVKYLSIWMILGFSHKLAYNHLCTWMFTILSALQLSSHDHLQLWKLITTKIIFYNYLESSIIWAYKISQKIINIHVLATLIMFHKYKELGL